MTQLPDRNVESYAGLGRRLAAYLVDLAIAFSVLFLAGITTRLLWALGAWVPAAVGVSPVDMWNTLGGMAKLLIMSTYILSLGPVYFTFFDASPWQATFGKRILSIYVTTDDGKRISTARSLVRWVTRWSCGWIGVITIPATKDRRAPHDYATRTVVLRGRPLPGGALEPWRIAVSLGLPFVWLPGIYLAVF